MTERDDANPRLLRAGPPRAEGLFADGARWTIWLADGNDSVRVYWEVTGPSQHEAGGWRGPAMRPAHKLSVVTVGLTTNRESAPARVCAHVACGQVTARQGTLVAVHDDGTEQAPATVPLPGRDVAVFLAAAPAGGGLAALELREDSGAVIVRDGRLGGRLGGVPVRPGGTDDWTRWWIRRGHRELSELLLEAWDPLDLTDTRGYSPPPDEYAGEATRIAEVLRDGGGYEEVLEAMTRIVEAHPPSAASENPARDERAARQIVNWYEQGPDRPHR